MSTCNCIGPMHPGCCRNRFGCHYHQDPQYFQPAPGFEYLRKGKCNGCLQIACACKEIQADKDKQNYDLVLQLEKRVIILEKELIFTKEDWLSMKNQINSIKGSLSMIWEAQRIQDNKRNG